METAAGPVWRLLRGEHRAHDGTTCCVRGRPGSSRASNTTPLEARHEERFSRRDATDHRSSRRRIGSQPPRRARHTPSRVRTPSKATATQHRCRPPATMLLERRTLTPHKTTSRSRRSPGTPPCALAHDVLDLARWSSARPNASPSLRAISRGAPMRSSPISPVTELTPSLAPSRTSERFANASTRSLPPSSTRSTHGTAGNPRMASQPKRRRLSGPAATCALPWRWAPARRPGAEEWRNENASQRKPRRATHEEVMAECMPPAQGPSGRSCW